MTSFERHEARHRRRKAKRDQRKAERNAGHTFEAVASFSNLRKAFYSARRGVNWKASVQRYGVNVLKNSMEASEKLKKGKPVSKGFIEFDIKERGKTRHIASVHITERVVQKSVCDYGIIPVMEKSLIYDNGASQKGKGTDFSRERLKKHLREYYRKYGTDGYVLLGDLHNFFGSIDQDICEQNMRRMITDQKLVDLTMEFIRSYPKGLSLGSQVCQINAVTYQNGLDHYIKEIRRCRWYARYNDDFYIICRTKAEAWELLKDIGERYRDIYHVELNRNKTQVVKLSHGFVWLQDRVYLLPTGRVINKPGREAITRNRRKLKKLAERVNNGDMPFERIINFYASHTGYLKHKNAYRTRCNIDRKFNDLLVRRFIHEKMCTA